MEENNQGVETKTPSAGRAKSGAARMASLKPEERSALGRSAANKRWTGPTAVESITEIKDIILANGDIAIPCAVLDGEIRVLTQNGVLKAVGRVGRPQKAMGLDNDQMPPFLAAQNIRKHTPDEAFEMCVPIPFKLKSGLYSWGYRAELLPLVCEGYLKAQDEGELLPNQKVVADRCAILVRGLARVGIIALVDEATGYQKERKRDALAKILEAYIAKELQPYVKTFPVEYYENLFRLRGVDFSTTTVKRPSYFGTLTNDIIYSRLAPGVLDELKRAIPRNAKGRPATKYFRLLTSNFGYHKLRDHLGGVVTLMRMSNSYPEFRSKLNEFFPRGGQLVMQLQYEENEDQGVGF